MIDASLVIALLLGEANVGEPDTVYEVLQTELLMVPAHWPAELANALLVSQRRGRIPAAKIDAIIDDLFAFRPIIDTSPSLDQITSVIQFAAKEKLTVYDAIYVQLALTCDASLATIDTDMRACARRLGVPLLPA